MLELKTFIPYDLLSAMNPGFYYLVALSCCVFVDICFSLIICYRVAPNQGNQVKSGNFMFGQGISGKKRNFSKN